MTVPFTCTLLKQMQYSTIKAFSSHLFQCSIHNILINSCNASAHGALIQCAKSRAFKYVAKTHTIQISQNDHPCK